MGKNLGEDRREGETKRRKHLGRDEKLRASDLVGGVTEIHICIFVRSIKKKPVLEGEGGRRRGVN